MKLVRELIIVTIGSLIIAIGVNDLMLPAHLMSGGLTGICILFYHFFRWPVGTQYLIFNIPLLVLAHRFIGTKFTVYSLVAVMLSSLLLMVIPIRQFTSDPLLAGVFGGIVTGAGAGMVLRVGGSSGGIDIISRIVAKYRNVSIARFSLVVNGLIILATAFMFDFQTAMYTLISIYTAAKAYEILLTHVGRISVLVVTEKGPAVEEKIVSAMRRGVTSWDAHGAYTRGQKQVLMCVIVNVQFQEFRQIVLSVDPNAFLTVVPAQSVIGNFNQVW